MPHLQRGQAVHIIANCGEIFVSEHFMRWPLRYQILWPFSGVMLVALAAVSFLNAWLAAQRAQEQIETQLRSVVRTLLGSSFPLTDEVLRQMRGLSGAEFVLRDERGRIQAASARLPVGRWPDHARIAKPQPTSNASIPEADMRLGNTLQIDGVRYFHAAVPVDRRGGVNRPAVLHILYPERVWQEARQQATYPSLVVGAVALLVVAVVSAGIAGRLSRPIALLRSQVGRLVAGEFHPVPLPARNDELRELVVSVNALAAQLDEMRRAIRRSERLVLLGQLSGGLAHRLRNDVAGARLAVQLHQRHCPQADRESLAVALRQLTLTEEHLQRFLSAGAPQPLRREACDVRGIVSDVAAILAPTFRHRRVELQIPVGADRNGEPAIDADRDQVRQALINLLLNALDAAGPGGRVRIETAVEADPPSQLLRVIDSGSGPPAELIDRLFEPFTTSKASGVGLGLAVSRQIAMAHGGTLRFTRRADETCFELSLPACSTRNGCAGNGEELLNAPAVES